MATPAVPRIGAPARQSRDSSPLVPRLDLVAAAAASQGQQGLQVSSATRRRRLWHAVHLASPHSVSWADDSATPAVKYGYPPGLPRAERSVSPEVTPTKSGVFRLQQASVAARLRQPAHASLLREEQEPPRSRGARLSCYPQSSELRTPTSTMESLRDSVRDSVDQFNLLTARGPLSASAMGLPPVREGTPDSLAWEADQATGHDLSDDESLSDFCDSDEDSIPDESLCDTPLFDTPECYSETSTPEDTPAAESGTSPALARTHMMPKLKLEETRRSLMTELTEVLNTRRSMAQDQGLLHHQAFDSVDLISSVTLQAGLSTEKPPTGKRGGFRAAGKFFRKAAGKLLK